MVVVVTFAVVAMGIVAAGVGLSLAHRTCNKQRGGKSSKLPSPAISVENEVEDDKGSAATAGDRILPHEEDGRFLTVHGVMEGLLEQDGMAMADAQSSILQKTLQPRPALTWTSSQSNARHDPKDGQARKQLNNPLVHEAFDRFPSRNLSDDQPKNRQKKASGVTLVIAYLSESYLTEVEDDKGSAATAGDRILLHEENGRFLTVHGVKEGRSEQDRMATEVKDDTVSAAVAGDRILPHEENGRFLTVHGVKEGILEEDGMATEGGFGIVVFLASKSKPDDKYALKKAKDTPAGRRQMRHETTFFARLCHRPPLDNVVRVADVRVAPQPMLLMIREKCTLADMLEGEGSTNIADVARVLDGALSGVEALYGAGFFHRDIKPDNILIGRDGKGILVDFGLHLPTSAAFDGQGVGDGTVEYAAPETERRGWSLPAETYSIFACFAEAVLGRCLFGGEELLDVKDERVADLRAAHEDLAEDVQYFRDEAARLTITVDNNNVDEEDLHEMEVELAASSCRMEAVRVQLWRLKLDVGSWVPGEVALAELTRLGPPLSFFISSEEGSGQDQDLHSRHMAACREAKAQPGKLFEEGWPNWLPSSSKADYKVEVCRTMEFLIGVGVLAPDPEARPSTVESAKKVLMAAAAMYQECSVSSQTGW